MIPEQSARFFACVERLTEAKDGPVNPRRRREIVSEVESISGDREIGEAIADLISLRNSDVHSLQSKVDEQKELIETLMATVHAAATRSVSVTAEGGKSMATSKGDDNSVTAGRDAIGVATGKSRIGDVSVYQREIDNSSHIDADLKSKLVEGRKEIDNLNLSPEDKEDVLHNYEQMSKELEKPQPEPSRFHKFWLRVKDAAPTVAKIVGTAATVAKLITMVHP